MWADEARGHRGRPTTISRNQSPIDLHSPFASIHCQIGQANGEIGRMVVRRGPLLAVMLLLPLLLGPSADASFMDFLFGGQKSNKVAPLSRRPVPPPSKVQRSNSGSGLRQPKRPPHTGPRTPLAPLDAMQLVDLLGDPSTFFPVPWQQIDEQFVRDLFKGKPSGLLDQLRRDLEDVGGDEAAHRAVNELLEHAAQLAPSKRFPISLLYTLFAFGEAICDSLKRICAQIEGDIKTQSRLKKLISGRHWPDVDKVRAFERELHDKAALFHAMARHLEALLLRVAPREMHGRQRPHLYAAFGDAFRVLPCKGAKEARQFVQACGTSATEQNVKADLRRIESGNSNPSVLNSAIQKVTTKTVCAGDANGKDKMGMRGIEQGVCRDMQSGKKGMEAIASANKPLVDKKIDQALRSDKVKKLVAKGEARRSLSARRRKKRAAVKAQNLKRQQKNKLGSWLSPKKRVVNCLVTLRDNRDPRRWKNANNAVAQPPAQKRSPPARRRKQVHARRRKRGILRIGMCIVLFVFAAILIVHAVGLFFVMFFNPVAFFLLLLFAFAGGVVTKIFKKTCMSVYGRHRSGDFDSGYDYAYSGSGYEHYGNGYVEGRHSNEYVFRERSAMRHGGHTAPLPYGGGYGYGHKTRPRAHSGGGGHTGDAHVYVVDMYDESGEDESLSEEVHSRKRLRGGGGERRSSYHMRRSSTTRGGRGRTRRLRGNSSSSQVVETMRDNRSIERKVTRVDRHGRRRTTYEHVVRNRTYGRSSSSNSSGP